jgi:pimeloyl-ACP methyl ester carboxylesterase
LNAGHIASIDTLTIYTGKTSLQLSQQELLKYGNFHQYGDSAWINDIKIYYEIYGEGEPLLLLHGNNESISSFKYQIDYFRKQYKVIAVDSRGQGKSSNNRKKIDYQLMAADMYELLNHLKLDSVNVIGWSDGGNTGLIMAMKYPVKVKSLTTMGANLYPNKNAVQKKFLREYRWTLRYAKVLALFNPSKWKGKVIVGKMVLKEPNIKPSELNAISIPTLILAGEKDVINEDHTKLIADNIKKNKIVILKGLTHYAPQEDPEYFNKVIAEFLTDIKVIGAK